MSELPIDEDEFSALDDGFIYYWPHGGRGCLSSHNLRDIADRLDEINKPWSDEIAEYFTQFQSNETVSTIDL